MTRLIFCQKLQKESIGLAFAPYPGEMGKRVYETISQAAWQMWVNHQTMLINENRLSLIDPKAREFLKVEMEKFLFGEGSEKPPGYVPEQKK